MINYRPMQTVDIQRLAFLIKELMIKPADHGVNVSLPEIVSTLTKSITAPNNNATFLAFDGVNLAGFSCVYLAKYFFSDDLMLADRLIWVDSNYYGQGVGESLFSLSKEWGVSNGAKFASFDVLIGLNDARGHAFFKKIGLKNVGACYWGAL